MAADTSPTVPTSAPLIIHIITLSDRASRGDYADRGGPAIQERVERQFAGTRWHLDLRSAILPDDPESLRTALKKAIDEKAGVIFTTGGTGIGPRDITPDVVAPLLEKNLPGIMEFIRVKYGATLPAALLSRGVAGVANQTLIYTLPGSVQAVNDYCDVILPTLEHSLLMLMAVDAH